MAPDEVGLGGEVVFVHQQKYFLLLNGFDFLGGGGDGNLKINYEKIFTKRWKNFNLFF